MVSERNYWRCYTCNFYPCSACCFLCTFNSGVHVSSVYLCFFITIQVCMNMNGPDQSCHQILFDPVPDTKIFLLIHRPMISMDFLVSLIPLNSLRRLKPKALFLSWLISPCLLSNLSLVPLSDCCHHFPHVYTMTQRAENWARVSGQTQMIVRNWRL